MQSPDILQEVTNPPVWKLFISEYYRAFPFKSQAQILEAFYHFIKDEHDKCERIMKIL